MPIRLAASRAGLRKVGKVTSFADNFVRADTTGANLGNGWVIRDNDGTSPHISGNKAVSTSGAHCNATAPLASVNADLSCTIAATVSQQGLLIHWSSAGNYWALLADGGVRRYVGGSATVPASTGTWAAGDIMRAVVNGTSLTVYKNGSPVLSSFTLDLYTTTDQHGLFFFNSGEAISNFTMLALP